MHIPNFNAKVFFLYFVRIRDGVNAARPFSAPPLFFFFC